jgi:predicted transposase YdaD
MAGPFDATLKDLVEHYPRDWMALLGIRRARQVTVIDADLSTVTALADKVIHVRDRRSWLLHLELQAGRDPRLPRRVLKYNVLLYDRHDLTARSVVILLRPEADAAELTGEVRYRAPGGRTWLRFRYEIVRLWQQPVETYLGGGLGTLPLSPLCDVSRAALPGVIRGMEERVEREAVPGEAATLWTSTYILMGLRYPAGFAAQLLHGVRAMKESTTYQAILDEGRGEGRVEEARRLLLLLGSERFGPPDARVQAALDAMDAVEPLERLSQHLLKVESWEELLAAS